MFVWLTQKIKRHGLFSLNSQLKNLVWMKVIQLIIFIQIQKITLKLMLKKQLQN